MAELRTVQSVNHSDRMRPGHDHRPPQKAESLSHRRKKVTAMDNEQEIRRLENLADWLDSRFRIPGTQIRFGLDAILGLLPGIGDGVLALPSAYLIASAHRLGISRFVLTRMIMNVGIDMVLGAVPLIGDIFDIGFKANRRNVALLRRHLADQKRVLPELRTSPELAPLRG